MSSKRKKKKTNVYYEKINVIRVLACIAILLYHLNILKGGYLAVCMFFTLSGYLLVISAFKKEKISFKDYYFNKFKHIYLPMILVVFITISIISFITSINWFNLKPETISVLLSYNNYWQLSANLDYFTRNISSPFTHLWYMSIIIEFYIIFPILFITLRKIGEKTKKIIPCIILGIITIFSYIFFYKEILDNNIMFAYYNSLTRIFSITLGMLLGFIHSYYHPLLSKKMKDKKVNRIIFYSYIIIQTIMFCLIDAKSLYFGIAMLITTLITIRLIDYSTVLNIKKLSLFDKIIKYIASISYEIYLIQYPVIFLFQKITINYYLKIIIIVIIVFILSAFLHYILNIKKDKHKFTIIILYTIILILTLFGIYNFIIAKDHTVEMKKLENQLAENKLLVQERQTEYVNKIKENNAEWQEILTNFENDEKNLKEVISNLPIIGIGDSIMLGAINSLYKTFPNGYFDAAISRTDWEANGILQNLKNRGLLSDTIIFNLGTNGECPQECKNEIFKTVGNRKLFWVNATKPDFPIFNTNLKNIANSHDNVYIIDWISASINHPEYFIADGIHLTKIGADAYAKTIYDSIYNTYLAELNKQKEEKIKEHDLEEKNKITFIGNDILLNAFDYLQDDYGDSEFIILNDFTYDLLIDIINDKINNNTLSYNIVIAFDNSLQLSNEEYKNIIKLCNKNKVYIVAINKTLNLNYENVEIIDFYKEINENNEYLMVDGIHLSVEGNNAFANIIKNNLNKNTEVD